MLRSMIFIGISTWSWCYALWSSLAFPHDLDATLYDLQMQWHTSASDSLGWGGVGWDDNVIDISTWSCCYALWSSLEFDMILMLRSMIFIGISTWSWCYALWSSLAFPRDLDATLYDLHWHFHMISMLRSMIFNCNGTHPHPIVWCGMGWDDNVISTLGFYRSYGLCNNALAKKYGLLLQQCNHSQGNFCRTRTLKNRGKVKIHTGHVDGFWKVLKKPSLEVYHRKRARHAILKYGNACALSSGGGGAQVKTWWKPPLTRWRKSEKKLRLPFFRLKSWKGCYSQSRWTFFLETFWMKKIVLRCHEIVIFIIFVRRQRFRRDVFV